MKYNVGDRVRIKSIDWYNKTKNEYGNIDCGNANFIPDMVVYCGEILTIRCVNEDLSYYYVDGCRYAFKDEMIEGIVEDTTIKIKDLRKFINQMEMEGLNDDTMLVLETKRSSEHIEKITSMEYSPTTNILIFGK